MNRPPEPARNALSAEDYPALRGFLRGYFHQDMKDEYGSAEQATRQFCADASSEEREAVAREWAQLLSRALGQQGGEAIDLLNRNLTGPLGSSYAISAEDLKRISAVLAESAAKAPSFSPPPGRPPHD